MVAFERNLALVGNTAEPPYASLLTLCSTGFSASASAKLSSNSTTLLNLDGVHIKNDITIARIIAQSSKKNKDLIGKTFFENAKIDEVLCLCEKIEDGFLSASEIFSTLELTKGGTLFEGRLTVADIALWAILAKSEELRKKHVSLFNKILEDPTFIEALNMTGKYSSKAVPSKEKQKDEGKFVELPGAEKGKVVVRFPPEASGYLHIGHAKAALLNQYYQQAFDGQLIMRFDDTNPAKENAHFEKVILEDLAMLEIKPDRWTHSSDHFELLLEMCEKLLKEEKAFVDDTDTESMRKEREERVDSKNRNNSVSKNLELWEEMKKGTERGTQCCVRIKIDMKSNNGAMRDPTIYRCKPEEHVRTGNKYKVYPTYDFTCPIVDSVEGVTHALRTTEYHDRDDQYYFICDALGIRKPYIWEYSRLNMTNTVMSKRKLTWFVEEKHVEGWDDPRLPTVRGVMRRGMTVEGLKQFIVAQGGSRSVVMMEWDKIWSFNKKVIDPIVPRYTALEQNNLVPVIVANAANEEAEVALHPKNPSVGNKKILRGGKLLIEQSDAREIKSGDTVTFVNWGNLKISSIEKKGDVVTSVHAQLDLENKDYKKTMKVTWLGDTIAKSHIPVVCAEYDHIISKAVIGKDEDWKQYINYDSVHYSKMAGEPALSNVKKGDIIQVQRKGFYICDHPYTAKSGYSDKEAPLLLIYIPDGHIKESKVEAKEPVKSVAVANNAADIYAQIEKQGTLVRDLKGKDAKSQATKDAIQKLLELKKQYKEVTGAEYKPGCPPASSVSSAPSDSKDSLYKQIEEQGILVRDLKSKDAKSDATKKAIATLLDLKKQYKEQTGVEWKPGQAPLSANTSSGVEKSALYKEIEDQGTLVRDLKGKDAKSDATKAAISKLLELKKQYKDKTGEEWKPGQSVAPTPSNISAPSGFDALSLYKEVENQGIVVRDLKAKDPKSDATKSAINKLLELKKLYKEKTGKEYKPGEAPAQAAASALTPTSSQSSDEIALEIQKQGDLVRDLKAKDAKSEATKSAINKLLELKKLYKEKTGKEYKPGAAPATAAVSAVAPASGQSGDEIAVEIQKQGDLVRTLKTKNAKSDDTKKAIEALLQLKLKYKEATGKDYQPLVAPKNDKSKKENDKLKAVSLKNEENAKKQKKNVVASKEGSDGKKQTKLGIDVAKYDNYSEWYSQVITKAEMIEYYDVSGCYVLRPWSYAIWEQIKKWFDTRIKRLGVKNCYFPMFVSQSALEREKDHIADFAPEVAWVTRAGSSEMAEPIAIRPTSETVMYPSYKKWVQSHRDLPIKLNQWCNVVRWEFKHPTPFLRTREFLWQEGHTAYANPKDAEKEVFQILDLYAGVYEELLAIPVVKGRKSEKEKFAGGDFTTTVEAYIPVNGRGVQGATSHHLGQNFSKMFDISYESTNGSRSFAWQNSWGLTTRTIGAMVMVHGDDNGLVMPPRVAAIQVIVIPVGITATISEDEKKNVMDAVNKLTSELIDAGVRAEADSRDNYSPGWKFNHWELKGVPLRLELGPKDMAASQVAAVVRHNGKKLSLARTSIATNVTEMLETVHKEMFDKVLALRNSHMKVVYNLDAMKTLLDEKFILLAPFCGVPDCEEKVKRDTVREDGAEGAQMGAKTLCIPLEQPTDALGDKCVHPECQAKPKAFALFGRSY